MSMKKKSGFLKLGVFLLISLLIGVGVTRGAWAGLKTEKEYNLYWQNSIFFYDPYECLGGYNDEEEEEEGGGGDPIEWDGNCSDLSSYTERLEKFYPIIKQIAEQHNLPWEGIMAQFIQESSAGKKECASHNPLGLMIKGIKTCRSFNSYEEAFNAYVNSYCAPKAAARNGRFANDPYGYAEFLNGEAGYGCQYNPGDNTYVPLLKSHICSIQKWAQETGKQISGSGSPNPSPSPSSSPSPSPSPSPSSDDDGYTKPNCPGTRKEEEDYDPGSNQEPRDEEEEEKEEEEEEEEEETPDGGDLVDLLKAWVWPDYKGSGFQQRNSSR